MGYWESGRWGRGTKNNLCLCFLCMAVSSVTLVLKLPKNFAKKAPVFESGLAWVLLISKPCLQRALKAKA